MRAKPETEFGARRLRLCELPCPHDPARLYETIADLPWSVFLDSGAPHGATGRYSILAAAPRLTLSTWGALTEIRLGRAVAYSAEDPLSLVRRYLGPAPSDDPGLPFIGGAIGYWAYDLGRRLECLPALARPGEPLPDMAVGIYDAAVVIDHTGPRCLLVGQEHGQTGQAPSWDLLHGRLQAARPTRAEVAPFRVRPPLEADLDREAYLAAFERIQRYIDAGDCYQVNLARRFEIPAWGDAWDFYRRLRAASPAPFGAYLSTPWGQVLSNSPERFLRVRDDQVETRPIKGTRPRAADAGKDRTLADALAHSPKDRAENVMIVDLLRNDLGRSCAPGSIAVPELCAVESFAAVHHLVSTVTGRLAADKDALDLLRGCFPGGSITGAPKLRAMEIIEELEPVRRGVYCGAIGYVGNDGGMDLNIAIRTLTYAAGALTAHAGGGIVADSDPEQEYQEIEDKLAVVLRLIGQCGVNGRGAVSSPWAG